MKKNIFLMAATSALMLTACSSENDVLQNTTQTQQQTAVEKAVGFDVYTPAPTNVTRAGQSGTMTTGRLQRTEANGGGFGVYAYLVEDDKADAGEATSQALDYVTWQNRTTPSKAPNFMLNEKLLWNSTNQGWYYNPLKYWPNETDKDSQSTAAEMIGSSSTSHLDRLTFFAYAPYVSAGADAVGVTKLTNKAGYLDADPTTETTSGSLVEASVGYKASLNAPSTSVDLLWGVAPAGGLSYTAVNGRTVTVPEGQPLIDMTKPDVNTNMKFLFQHALARIGINVVAAIDQVGAGGNLNTNETKITIKQVTLKGKFGETGILNLDNPTPNVAHWVDINGTTISSSTTALSTEKTLTLTVDNGGIAPDLRYAGPHTFGSYAAQTVGGVTTSKKDLITPRYFTLDAIPAYSPAKKYYSDGNGTEAVAHYTTTSSDYIYSYDPATDVYTHAAAGTILNSPAYHATNSGYYSIAGGSTYYNGNNIKTPATNYTTTSAAAYNAGLSGALPNDGTTGLTADQANAYNAKLPGALSTTALTAEQATAYNSKFVTLTASTGLSADEANAYNAATGGTKTAGSTLTDDEVTAYNTAVGGPKNADDALTAAQANAYNSLLAGAKKSGNTITADQANTYNALLAGAVDTSMPDPSTTVYGYNLPAATKLYTRSGTDPYVYTYAGKASETTLWGADKSGVKYYRVTPTNIAATDIAFAYTDSPIYDAERNYFMVVPTNNVKQLNPGLDDDVEKNLRTVRVMIEYYITTEDSKVAGGRTQTMNVIEKDVLFPSLANGKSYMLNLILGLTSVKMEAEVDDWKVINVQADLPQNTAD